MPPKAKPAVKDVMCLLVDVGANVKHFDKVKQCAFNIYKNKLLKDKVAKLIKEMGVIILGSEESENDKNYKHISVAGPPAIPLWEHLKAIHNIQQSQESCHWVEGLEVAMDVIQKQEISGGQYEKRVIVLVTDLGDEEPSYLENVDKLLIKYSTDLIIIGVDENSVLSEKWDSSRVEMKSYDQCLEETKFTPCSFRKPMAWNVTLTIGDAVLPITGFKWIGVEYGNIWSMVKDKSEHVVRTSRHEKANDPEKTALEVYDLIRAYHYGGTLVPMSDEEKNTMKYDSGERGLQLICFTHRRNVPSYILEDDKVYVITNSVKNEDNSLLISLIREMVQMNYVAIVRQVYSKNSRPYVQVMYPFVIEGEEEDEEDSKKYKYYLAMVHLPFAQQMNNMKVAEIMEFNNWFKDHAKDFTQEEEEAVQEYIEELDVAKDVEYKEDIPYLPESTRDPSKQVLHHYQTLKQVNPDAIISENTLPQHIKQLYIPSKTVHEGAEKLKEALNEIMKEIEDDKIKEEEKENEKKKNNGN